MRILFDNELINAVVTYVTENPNYPLFNLKDNFLKRIYKGTDLSEIITITFSTARSIDCCYIGYTNANTATLRLYSVTSVLLDTQTVNIANNGGVFSTVENVKYCTLTLGATANVYIGTIGIGDSYTLPDPLNNVMKDYIDNSSEYLSKDGQYAKNKIQWLKKVETDHYVLSMDDYNIIYALFADNERPVWVDIYESLDYGISPFYAKIDFKANNQSWRKYNFSVTSTEAR